MSKREHHSADEIERDIRVTEDEIARTFDLLQEKLSPGAVIDALWKSSRDNGAQFAANFGRSIRDNPLPITLIGTGLAWLMLSRRGDGDHRHEAVEYSAVPEPHEAWTPETEDAERIYHAGVYQTGAEESEGSAETEVYVVGSEGTGAASREHAAPGSPGSAEIEALEGAEPPESGAAAAARRAEESARAAAHVAQERARTVTDRADASGQGAQSAASETYESARSAAGETYESARSAAGETYESVRSAAAETYESVRSAAGETYESARSATGETYESARSAAEDAYSGARSAADKAYSGAKSTAHKVYSSARSKAEHAAERLQSRGGAAYRRGSEMAYQTTSRATEAVSTMGSSFREHPIIAGAILVGIGALVGALLPPTRREDALLGDKSDAAKAMAAEAAEREARRAREVARAAAEAARREAEARGLTPESIAGKAEEEIRRMADAGKEVARAAVREGEAAVKKDSGGDKGVSRREEKRIDREEKRSDPDKSEEEGSVRDPYLGAQVAPPPRPAVTPLATDVQPESPIEDKDPLK